MTSLARVAVMFAISGALAGFTISGFIPRRYHANAEFSFTSAFSPEAVSLFDSAARVTLLPQSLERMIRRSPYYRNRLYVEPVGDVVAEIRNNLSIKGPPWTGSSSSRGTIDFEYDDRDAALDVARVMLSEFSSNAARAANVKNPSEVIRIVEAPRAWLIGFTPPIVTALGLGSGLLAGFCVWFLLRRSRR